MPTAQDAAEIARSASEASKITIRDVDFTRYQNPPADTCYPLEYAFYLLGDAQDAEDVRTKRQPSHKRAMKPRT